ncbi:hypothetical protein SE17_40335, partial [Kouleothrix aurantiaca]
IARGGSATYRLTLAKEGNFGSAVSLSAGAVAGLTVQLSSSSLTPPGTTTLTLTDTSPPGPALPGTWRTVTVTATGGGKTRTLTVKLLVGGARVNVPAARR